MMKPGQTLTQEEKEQVMNEIAHYLYMDCYDFGISVNGFNLAAGELVDAMEAEIEKELEETSDDI